MCIPVERVLGGCVRLHYPPRIEHLSGWTNRGPCEHASEQKNPHRMRMMAPKDTLTCPSFLIVAVDGRLLFPRCRPQPPPPPPSSLELPLQSQKSGREQRRSAQGAKQRDPDGADRKAPWTPEQWQSSATPITIAIPVDDAISRTTGRPTEASIEREPVSTLSDKASYRSLIASPITSQIKPLISSRGTVVVARKERRRPSCQNRRCFPARASKECDEIFSIA